MTDGEPETAVSASLQKIKSIENQHTHFSSFSFSSFLYIFYFIKSQTCDSFVNHFDGHFAFLKTLDFSSNVVCDFSACAHTHTRGLWVSSLIKRTFVKSAEPDSGEPSGREQGLRRNGPPLHVVTISVVPISST